MLSMRSCAAAATNTPAAGIPHVQHHRSCDAAVHAPTHREPITCEHKTHVVVCRAVRVQGGWEDDETLEAAARRETVEEAGVRGSIEVRQEQEQQLVQAGPS
jgi:8-oxo-dGTP pyrophosphatase MutT (NUDIX family)